MNDYYRIKVALPRHHQVGVRMNVFEMHEFMKCKQKFYDQEGREPTDSEAIRWIIKCFMPFS